MPDARISELIQRTPNGQEFLEVIIPPFTAGTNRKVLMSDILAQIGNYRGDWAGASAFPATGGTFTDGVPAAGNRWRLTAVLTIGSDVYDIGSIIEAAINTPGQTRANWTIYSVQI